MKQTGKAKILIIICIIVLCAVTYRTTGTINLVVNGIKTEGTIIGHSCKPINSFDSTGSVQILCTLKVSYLDKNNQKHEFETDVLAREESYPKGTTVNVIYSEENKLNANIYSFKPLWLINVLGYVFSLIFLGLAYLGIKVYKEENG